MPPEPAEHGDDHLEEPENEEELNEDLENESEEIRKEFDADLRQTLESLNQAIKRNTAAIDKLTFESPIIDAIETPVEDPAEDVAEEDDKDKKDGLADLKKSESTVLESLWGKATELAKTRVGKLFLTAFAIGGVAAAERLINYIEQVLNNKNNPPSKPEGMSDKDKEKIDEAIKKWAELEDDEYWKKIAKYVDSNDCNKPDIVYFMQFTVKLFPSKSVFIWKKSSDQSKMANDLVDKYKKDQDMRGWIEDLSELEYNKKPLPRSVTAGTARLALTRMIDKKIA